MKVLVPYLNETVLKEVVVRLCTNVVEGDGYDAEIMCPNTVDNYARHVSAKIILY